MTETAKKAVKKKAGRPAHIECVALKKIGLADRTANIGETVKLPREAAKKLQEAGAVKVML